MTGSERDGWRVVGVGILSCAVLLLCGSVRVAAAEQQLGAIAGTVAASANGRAVAEAVVFSVPDEVLGERVGLVVFPKAGKTIDPGELRDFVAADLAGFKVPERIWISPTSLPRLGTAKFDKLTVKKIALQHI